MNLSNQSARLRVLHPITRLIVGGAQENTFFTAALLDKNRYEVEVLSGPQTGSEGSLIEEIRQSGIPLTIVPDLVRQISPLQDWHAFWEIYRFLHRGHFTIVHTHSSKAGILGRLAAKIAGTPVIVHTVHGWSFHKYMSPGLRWIYIFLERWMASFTDALIIVTQNDRTKGLTAGIGDPEQYHCIRSAIPLDAFDPANYSRTEIRKELGLSTEAVVVGNVGRFSQQKNPLDWIRVAEKIAQDCPNVFFLLVGDGPLRREVENLIQVSGILDRTILTGIRRDVPRLMAAMDVFLLTSLWEGLPRVIPQAMAMKLPVVANRADGTVEAIRHGQTGYLCSPGDIKQMAKYCIELCNNPDLRSEMGHLSNKIAFEEFDLLRMIKQIDNLYLELLRKRNT